MGNPNDPAMAGEGAQFIPHPPPPPGMMIFQVICFSFNFIYDCSSK